MASRGPNPKRVITVPIPLTDLERLIELAIWGSNMASAATTSDHTGSLELAKKRYEIYARIS